MKKCFIFILLVLFCIHSSMAQITPNTKMGKPTDEEMSMTSYQADPDADAVLLYSSCVRYYTLTEKGFKIRSEHKGRIKILKESGKRFADRFLKYYDHEGDLYKEDIHGLKATAYNMEDGKLTKTKMTNDMEFRERLDKDYIQLKFTVPQVKVGTVIEYQYTEESDLFYIIDNWYGQFDIPVVLAEYDLTIPEYFLFHISDTGISKLTSKISKTNWTSSLAGGMLRCNATNYQYTAENMPAIRENKYISCARDYCAQVTAELKGINFPGTMQKNYTQSWDDIDKSLVGDSDFGGRIKKSNPLEQEMASLSFSDDTPIETRIAAVYTMLKSKVRWNGEYKLWARSASKILKDGTGSNADINFILISMLRNAGLEAYPIILSSRDKGVLPLTHPTMAHINTMVVGVMDGEKIHYIDGSVEDGFVDVLPDKLLVNRARLISDKGKGRWVDMQQSGDADTRIVITAEITETGALTGTAVIKRSRHAALETKHAFRMAKDSTEYVKRIETNENITISKYSQDGMHDFSPSVVETIEFSKSSDSNGHTIYVNPFIFKAVNESPFTAEQRILPVEFPFKQSISITETITIPDGMTVEELPKGVRLHSEDGMTDCRVMSSANANTINLQYRFQLKKVFFLSDEYPTLRNIFEMLAEKGKEVIVLKRQ